MAANLVLIGVAPSWWVLACALFIAGPLDAVAEGQPDRFRATLPPGPLAGKGFDNH